MTTPIDQDAAARIAEFVLADTAVPTSALAHTALLLTDTVGIAAGAHGLEIATIVRDLAPRIYGAGTPADRARMILDGRPASIAGSAWAIASQIDNLDGHDGYNPTKGHIGAAAVPALLAFSEVQPQLSCREAIRALAIAYEVAARAGLSLHSTVSDYHTSGAWNGLGVAAMGCRLKGCDAQVLRQALGIAEYHGPRSQMMREIDNPTMLHDGSGVGALVGISATLMAEAGFTGAPAITVEAEEVQPLWADLGEEWTVALNYIKPYPICRWAHAAIDAVWALKQQRDFRIADVRSVTIRTFGEASRLFRAVPQTTSQAQYAISWPVAVMIERGAVGPKDVQEAAFGDPVISSMLDRIQVEEHARHSDRFPVGRWSDVAIEFADGSVAESGDVHARGGPEAPMSEEELRAKFMLMCEESPLSSRASEVWEQGLQLHESERPFSEFTRLLFPD